MPNIESSRANPLGVIGDQGALFVGLSLAVLVGAWRRKKGASDEDLY
jgi:hypothetical protein